MLYEVITIFNHMEQLVSSIGKNIDVTLENIEILDKEEKEKIIIVFLI